MDTTDKIKNLKKSLTEAKELVVENNQDPNFRAWKKLTLRTLCKIFGKESNEATEFENLNFQFCSNFWIGGKDYTNENLKQFREDLEVTIQLLENYIQDFEDEIKTKDKTDKIEVCNNMRIFISHSSEDKEYGNALVNLLIGIGIEETNIVFTSNSNYGIPMGKNIYEYLKQEINNKAFIIYLLSPRYYKSIPCLNEMGAAWVVENKHIIIYTPDFKLSSKEFQNCAIDSKEFGFKINDENQIWNFTELLKDIYEIDKKGSLVHDKINQYLSEINKISSYSKKTEDRPKTKKEENIIEEKATKFIADIQNNKYSNDEILLIRFIYDTGNYYLYINSMLEDDIKEWEKENDLNSFLTNKYFQALKKLIARKLAVKENVYDSYEVRIIEEIKDIIIDFPEFLQKATDEVMKKNLFELPF